MIPKIMGIIYQLSKLMMYLSINKHIMDALGKIFIFH